MYPHPLWIPGWPKAQPAFPGGSLMHRVISWGFELNIFKPCTAVSCSWGEDWAVPVWVTGSTWWSTSLSQKCCWFTQQMLRGNQVSFFFFCNGPCMAQLDKISRLEMDDAGNHFWATNVPQWQKLIECSDSKHQGMCFNLEGLQVKNLLTVTSPGQHLTY